MKKISLLDLRNNLGTIMEEVAETGETVMVFKKNELLAQINPVSFKQRATDSHYLDRTLQILQELPADYRTESLSPDLVALIGKNSDESSSGQEDEAIHKHWDEKYG